MTSKCLKMITLLNGKSSHENVFKKPIDYSQTDSDEFDEIINSINKQKRKKTSRNYEMDSDTKNFNAVGSYNVKNINNAQTLTTVKIQLF